MGTQAQTREGSEGGGKKKKTRTQKSAHICTTPRAYTTQTGSVKMGLTQTLHPGVLSFLSMVVNLSSHVWWPVLRVLPSLSPRGLTHRFYLLLLLPLLHLLHLLPLLFLLPSLPPLSPLLPAPAPFIFCDFFRLRFALSLMSRSENPKTKQRDNNRGEQRKKQKKKTHTKEKRKKERVLSLVLLSLLLVGLFCSVLHSLPPTVSLSLSFPPPSRVRVRVRCDDATRLNESSTVAGGRGTT